MVRAERIRKSYGAFTVLADVSLEVGRGEVVCVIGPSGSGKSTLLRCLNFLEEIDDGRITVDGELIGCREVGAGFMLCPSATCAGSAPPSAWCFSASICSRT